MFALKFYGIGDSQIRICSTKDVQSLMVLSEVPRSDGSFTPSCQFVAFRKGNLPIGTTFQEYAKHFVAQKARADMQPCDLTCPKINGWHFAIGLNTKSSPLASAT